MGVEATAAAMGLMSGADGGVVLDIKEDSGELVNSPVFVDSSSSTSLSYSLLWLLLLFSSLLLLL